MVFSKRLFQIITFVLILGIAIVFSAYYWYQVSVLKPYINFLQQEKQATVVLDALNDNVFQELPPLPPGSSIQKTTSVGIDSPSVNHGRWLFIDISTNQKQDFILKYYSKFLLEHGWGKNTELHAFDNAFYFKGTACIEISPPSDIYPYYHIYIWHDYKSQDFAPVIPKHISWFEHQLTNFATCP